MTILRSELFTILYDDSMTPSFRQSIFPKAIPGGRASKIFSRVRNNSDDRVFTLIAAPVAPFRPYKNADLKGTRGQVSNQELCRSRGSRQCDARHEQSPSPAS